MSGRRWSSSSAAGRAAPNPGHHDRVQRMYRDQIIAGMARRLWVFAWMNFVLEHESICPHCGGLGLRTERPDGSVYWTCEECEREFDADTQHADWDATTPLTPIAARQAAESLASLIQQTDGNDVLSLFEMAMLYDRGSYFEWEVLEPRRGVLEFPPELADLAIAFGSALAMESLLPSDDFGAKFGAWARDHTVQRGTEVFEPKLPSFEVEYFDGNLNWSGEGRWIDAGSGTLIDETTGTAPGGGTMRAELRDYGDDPTVIVRLAEWRLQIDREDAELQQQWFRAEGRRGEHHVAAAVIPVETREAMIRLGMRLWNARGPR